MNEVRRSVVVGDGGGGRRIEAGVQAGDQRQQGGGGGVGRTWCIYRQNNKVTEWRAPREGGDGDPACSLVACLGLVAIDYVWGRHPLIDHWTNRKLL